MRGWLLLFVLIPAACAPSSGAPDGSPPDAPPPAADARAGAPDAAPPPDGPPPTKRYLDRCTSSAECISGLCVTDVGGSGFCSKACTVHGECAHEHLCAANICVPDDTGKPCNVVTPETCMLGLCLGVSGGDGACTRECFNASECPAGYACTQTGGSAAKICVDIEKPCAGPEQCGTGLCLSVQGCTAECVTAADCPARVAGLPPYTCEIAFGSTNPICVPPSDIIGADAAGALCTFDGSGFNQCRSGACDDGATPGPTCTQACTPQGGCGPGLGCFPLADGGDVILVCTRAGASDVGDGCGAAADCHLGLCDATGFYCTRLCHDGLCPTGWTCQTVAGTGISVCRQ